MMTLLYTPKSEIEHFGRKLLYDYRDKQSSFEEIAQQVAEEIYGNFWLDSDESQFALLRVFRLFHYKELSPELKLRADANTDFWMALMGTYGDQVVWRNRYQSVGHQVFPAGDQQSPMLKAAFEQIDLKPGQITDTNMAFMEGSALTPHFHVENAPGNPYIPAQDEFVIPYKIKSVVGIGCAFLSKALYLMIGFSKTPIDKNAAENFASLSPFVSTLFASHDAKRHFWAD